MTIKERIAAIIGELERFYGLGHYPEKDPFKVLISTILSQRTRDENTALASKRLFERYDTPEKLFSAPEGELRELIRPAGFYNQKAATLKKVSEALLLDFEGVVPDSLDELVTLPGVGRKTANCVLVHSFNVPAIPVDVHVHRISNRMGLVRTKSPEETEKELMKKVPKELWMPLNELMVQHGRNICRPVGPRCSKCPVEKFCLYEDKILD